MVGGAKGVLLMDPPTTSEMSAEKQGAVYLLEDETLQDLVPVLWSAFDQQLWEAVMTNEVVHLKAGSSVGVRPLESHRVSAGGVRIYDAVSHTWHFGGGGFTTERWMEHSQVRDAARREMNHLVTHIFNICF